MTEEVEEGAGKEEAQEDILVTDIVKQFVDVATETDPIVDSPVKTFVHMGTQTEPSDIFTGYPAMELSPERRRRNVATDHSYSCKPKPFVDPHNEVANEEPHFQPVENISELSDDDSDEEWNDDFDDASSVAHFDSSDEEWNPSDEDDSDDENANVYHCQSSNWLAENENPDNESKSIVFDSCLKQLFQICRKCGTIVKNAYLSQKGSLICVTTECKAGHIEPWFSQPFTKGMATGNLICSGGILFTGNHFTRVNAVMSACNIRFFKKSTFYYIQRKYLWPVVNNHFLKQQKEVLQSLRGQHLVLAGDGRCDSPGHNAKYGTYSLIEVTTEKIIDFSLVQVSEVANSNCMEKEGLKRCLQFLEEDGQVIMLLATDRYMY